MGKVLYSDFGRSILELMDCQCEVPQLSRDEELAEYDRSIGECSALLNHYLDMAKSSEEGSARQLMAKEEVAYWSRMLKTAKTERRRLLTA